MNLRPPGMRLPPPGFWRTSAASPRVSGRLSRAALRATPACFIPLGLTTPSRSRCGGPKLLLLMADRRTRLPNGGRSPAHWTTSTTASSEASGSTRRRSAAHPSKSPNRYALCWRVTSTLDVCWFGVSDIWGPSPYDAVQAAPKFGTEERRYFLLKGSLRSALSTPIPGGDHLPDLWWPGDHAWFVGSDVDLLSTYVGGSNACIDAILSEGSLEVLPVSVDQSVAWDTDTINPLPPSPRIHTRD
jgi:hypothetical protein